MYYYNKVTKQYGVTFQDAKATVNASIPDGTKEFGDWQGYVDVDHPKYNALTQTVVEREPTLVEGVLTQTWVIENLSPEDVAIREASFRKQLHSQIQAWRDAQENGGIVHNNNPWDTDTDARDRILSVLAIGVNPLGYWTNKDNVNVPMNIDGLRALWAAIVQRGAEIHTRQRQMKDAIELLHGDDLLNYKVGWNI